MEVEILVLVGCNLVLGIKWLHELGVVLWDFEKLFMKFCYGGKEFILYGLPAMQMIKEGPLHMLNKLENKGVILHLLLEEKLGTE